MTWLQNILEGSIVIGVMGGIGLIYWAKIAKKTPSQILKELFSMKLFYENPPDTNKSKMEEQQQIWQEARTRM